MVRAALSGPWSGRAAKRVVGLVAGIDRPGRGTMEPLDRPFAPAAAVSAVGADGTSGSCPRGRSGWRCHPGAAWTSSSASAGACRFHCRRGRRAPPAGAAGGLPGRDRARRSPCRSRRGRFRAPGSWAAVPRPRPRSAHRPDRRSHPDISVFRRGDSSGPARAPGQAAPPARRGRLQAARSPPAVSGGLRGRSAGGRRRGCSSPCRCTAAAR